MRRQTAGPPPNVPDEAKGRLMAVPIQQRVMLWL